MIRKGPEQPLALVLLLFFSGALPAAPWNDSLRARIYVHYAYFASIHPDPLERERLMRRASALYETGEDAATPRE